MSRPLNTNQRATPARQVILTETVTAYGGRTPSFSLGATIWGQFSPHEPTSVQSSEGEFYTHQTADFVCDVAGSLTPSDRLRIRGEDYLITSLTQTQTGAQLIKMERIFP